MRMRVELFCYGMAVTLCLSVGCGQAEKAGQGPRISPESAATESTDSHQVQPRPRDPQAISIPLDRIWAMDMEGTRNLRELEKDPTVGNGRVDEIVSALIDISHDLRSKEKLAKQGFAVAGSDAVALRNVHAILVGGKELPRSLPTQSDVTLVLFLYFSAVDFQVRAVEHREHTIDIKYRFAQYPERIMNMQVALVPLGKLPPGTYDVKMDQLPAIQRLGVHGKQYEPINPPLLAPSPYLLISQPFSFDVANSEE